MKKIFISGMILISLILIIGINGCSGSNTLSQNFTVDYYATYSSSGGDRILNISYAIENGAVSSCQGTYSSPPSQEQENKGIFNNNIEKCDIQKLKNKEYNVPLVIITNISKNQKMSEEFTDGLSFYRYKIIL